VHHPDLMVWIGSLWLSRSYLLHLHLEDLRARVRPAHQVEAAWCCQHPRCPAFTVSRCRPRSSGHRWRHFRRCQSL